MTLRTLRSPRSTVRGACVGLALLLTGCRDTPPTASVPVGAQLQPSSTLRGCDATCLLTEDPRPFTLAGIAVDTADATLPLARIRVGGTQGATVSLGLDSAAPGGAAWRTTAPILVIRVDGTTHRYSGIELARGIVIHQFMTADTVTVEYRLLRGLRAAPDSTSRLVQRLSGAASVLEASRPWVHARKVARMLAPGTECTVAESGTVCGDAETTADIAPYYANYDGFGSDWCCGQSGPITIQFNVAMSSVTVTAADPDFPGNTITAFDSLGNQVDMQSFVGDGIPGADNFTTDTRTVTGRISSIRLDAPIGEYVYYLPFQLKVAGPAPTITSVSPTPLVPGATAVIDGTNFNATTASNVVMIGTQVAPIVSGSVTQLTVTVPCTSGGIVPVTVKDAGQTSAPFPRQLNVAQQVIAVGQSVVLPTAAASRCNELPSANGAARYVMAVVNVRPDASTLIPLQLSAARIGAPEPVSGALRAAAARPTSVSLPSDEMAGASIVDVIERKGRMMRSQAHRVHLRRNAESYGRLRASGPGLRLSSTSVAAVVAPPATATFRVANINHPTNQCNTFWVVSATRVFSSGKVAIYEDNATPTGLKSAGNAKMKTYYTNIGTQFNADMEPTVRTYFGDILRRDAVTDNNGVMIMLFTPKITTNSFNVDGFAQPCDQFARDDATSRAVGGPYTGTGINGASNRAEIVYLRLPTVTGTGYSTDDPDQWYRDIRSVVIHESKHVAALAARAQFNFVGESEWLEEGTAVVAEELWARLAVDKASVTWKGGTGFGSSAKPVSVFCDLRAVAPCASGLRPAHTLIDYWAGLRESLAHPGRYSPLGATAADTSGFYMYPDAWSLIRYATDRYATSTVSDATFLTALTTASDTGVRNLELRTGVSIGQLLGGRALSMYANNYPGLTGASPDIRFPSWNLRDIFASFNGTSSGTFAFPLLPTPLTFGAAVTTAVVALPGGSAAWYELSGPQSASQLLRLEGSAGAVLAPDLRLAIARLQ